MKCNICVSESSSMSGNISRFSLKFRFLALVVNTADLINERTTPTLGVSHAILAPVTLTTTYIFMSVITLGACQRRYASDFLLIYSLVSCCSLQISLSIMVFNDLKNSISPVTDRDVGLVLNGVLPIFITILLIADLIVILFTKRDDDLTLPSVGGSQTDLGHSRTHSITVMPDQENKDADKTDSLGKRKKQDLRKLNIIDETESSRSVSLAEQATDSQAKQD